MTEKILTTKKNGMAVMLGCLGSIILSIVLFAIGVEVSPLIAVPAVILLIVSVIALAGLKVLKPQEALVLTLFGKYVGTIKGEGFYWVNPSAPQ